MSQPINNPVDEWIAHDGGKCPVHPKTIVDVRFGRGMNPPIIEAEMWDWSGVKRYQVIREASNG